MSQKPIIGLTAANIPTPDWGERGLQLNRDGQGRLYSEAVALGGGLPVVLPLVRTPLGRLEDEDCSNGPGHMYENAQIYLEHLDGLILCGGGDLAPPPGAEHPERYHRVDHSRDVWETALLHAALALDKPVLGICRGLQLMNAALGGTLWADLPEERPGPVEHAQKLPRARATHPVFLEPDTPLARIIKFSEIMVNSGHHQGVKDPAPSLAVAAKAADGLVEALVHREARFALGVQWHPEGQLAADNTWALFSAFIKAARG